MTDSKNNDSFECRDKTGRFRHEYKYMIDAKMESVLLIKAAGIMQRDSHVNENGTYLIRSLYFDDLHDSCLSENLIGVDPRSKFRIRYYNNTSDRPVLEKKSKVRGMCLKESCNITETECNMLIGGNIPLISEDMPKIKKRLFTEMQLRCLLPKVIVTYERIPFVYSGGNVRVTFDKNITSSVEIEKFLTGDYTERPVLQSGNLVLEVKWDEIIPRHIKEFLTLDKLRWTAFSKYAMCRKFHM